jgi:glutamine synthetase adenylyltransferase
VGAGRLHPRPRLRRRPRARHPLPRGDPPFVWRRALDFGAIDDIRDISLRIRDHYAQGQEFGPGYDLKRGRGGIREAEFFTQVQQLVHGGREPALRAPATLDALAALAGPAGSIPRKRPPSPTPTARSAPPSTGCR